MFAFSAEDRSLSLPFSGRDPLGTQVVWQWRARDVVPALTAASRQPEGFQLLFVALAWWPEFAGRFKRPQKDIRNFFLLIEQAFARACKMTECEWRLPGSKRLNDSQDPDLWIGLDPRRDFLLDSPLTNGTWGIYRGPAIKARQVDQSDRLPVALETQVKNDSQVVRWLFGSIQESLEHPSTRVPVAHRRSSNVEKLSDVLKVLPQTYHIRKVFTKPEHDPLTGKLSDIALQNIEETIEHLITRARRELKDPNFISTLYNVESCERYITCLDISFERLVCNAGYRIEELLEKIRVNMHALRAAQDRFRTSGVYQGLALERHSKLVGAPLDSPQSLIEFMIDHHKSISAARRTAPLLFWGDTNRLESVLINEPSEEDVLDARRTWRNNYYLDSLRNLASLTLRKDR